MEATQSFASFHPAFRVSSLGLDVYYAGIQECQPGHAWKPAFRDHFLLHVVLQGAGRFESDYHRWDLQSGHAFLIRPNVRAGYVADMIEPWKYAWVGFNGAAAIELLEQAGLSPAAPVCRGGQVEKIYPVMSRLRNWLAMGEEGALGATGAFLELLAGFAADSKSASLQQMKHGQRAELYLCSAMSFMENNLSYSIRIADVARHLGIDRTHLSRLFKQKLNSSPERELTRLRMKKACELLSMRNVRVKEAAYSVGYNDPLHFSRMFRKLHALSPEQYRLAMK